MNNKESIMRKEVYKLSNSYSKEQLTAMAHLSIDMQQYFVEPNEERKKFLVTIKVEEIE